VELSVVSAVVKQLQTTSRIRIEKGVAMPARHGTKPCPYPFMDMSVGDSFFIETSNGAAHNIINRLNRHKARFMKENPVGYKFESRRVPGGVRCWRVK
jgi:hypothetical protein